MKHIPRIIISFFCFCLVGCTFAPKELHTAEQLMDTAPDSAFQILKQINPSRLFTPSHKALFALLMSQALDKNDIKVESDSLIHIATDYYTESEPQHAAYAWFYSARVANNKGEAKPQADALLKAQEYAEKTKNSKLKGLVYVDKGLMYKAQGQFDSAIFNYKRSNQWFIKIHDTRNSILGFLNIGDAYLRKSQYNESINYFQLAERQASNLNDTLLLSCIYRSLGTVYLMKNNFHKALQCYHKAPLTHVQLYDDNKWFLIANVFMNTGNTDSTRIYLNKISVLLEMAPDYYLLWQTLYEKEGNTAKALHSAKLVNATTDSLSKRKLDESFGGLDKKYKFRGIEIAKQQLEIKNKQYGIIILVVLLVLSMFSVVVLFWQIKVKKQQVESQKQLVLKEHALLKHEIDNNKLLEIQNKMQSILLSNVEQYRTNSVKRHQYPNEKNIISPILNLTFHEELIANMDIQYRDISKRLIVQYPKLTSHDILVCCLLLANFETGMIAAILDLKNDSIRIHRTRIRKKLELQNSDNLTDFLRNF